MVLYANSALRNFHSSLFDNHTFEEYTITETKLHIQTTYVIARSNAGRI